MKKIFIAGSRKFHLQINELVLRFKENDIMGLIPEKNVGVDSFEYEKEKLFLAFEMIRNADLIYLITNDGYVGKTVAIEMAYAFAIGKQVIASEEIIELSARALVDSIKNTEEIIEFIEMNS